MEATSIRIGDKVRPVSGGPFLLVSALDGLKATCFLFPDASAGVGGGPTPAVYDLSELTRIDEDRESNSVTNQTSNVEWPEPYPGGEVN